MLYLTELQTYRALTRAERLLDGGVDPLRALIGAAQVEGVLAPELALVLLRKVIAVRRAREALASDARIDHEPLYAPTAESGAEAEHPAP